MLCPGQEGEDGHGAGEAAASPPALLSASQVATTLPSKAQLRSCPVPPLPLFILCGHACWGGAAQSSAVPVLGSWKRVPKNLPAGDLGLGQWLESGVCMRVKNQNQWPGWQSCVSGLFFGCGAHSG